MRTQSSAQPNGGGSISSTWVAPQGFYGASGLIRRGRVRLDQVDLSQFDVVSTDLFDTVLMRDLSSERSRFDEAARVAAARFGLDPARLSALRRLAHNLAYKAVSAEHPLGDACLGAIYRTVATTMGHAETAAAMQAIEVETDIRHLAPNLALLRFYEQLAATGKRIIAISDTYYTGDEIGHILDAVVGRHPIARIYASCDVGLTKHSGALFAEVARREGVSPSRIVHYGDDPTADVHQARAAGLAAVHLPRAVAWRRFGKLGAKIAMATPW